MSVSQDQSAVGRPTPTDLEIRENRTCRIREKSGDLSSYFSGFGHSGNVRFPRSMHSASGVLAFMIKILRARVWRNLWRALGVVSIGLPHYRHRGVYGTAPVEGPVWAAPAVDHVSGRYMWREARWTCSVHVGRAHGVALWWACVPVGGGGHGPCRWSLLCWPRAA